MQAGLGLQRRGIPRRDKRGVVRRAWVHFIFTGLIIQINATSQDLPFRYLRSSLEQNEVLKKKIKYPAFSKLEFGTGTTPDILGGRYPNLSQIVNGPFRIVFYDALKFLSASLGVYKAYFCPNCFNYLLHFYIRLSFFNILGRLLLSIKKILSEIPKKETLQLGICI